MKIAAYTCALNEEKFAERWARSVAACDQCLVLDTGSTDRTVETLRDLKIDVREGRIKPWRFDDARNFSLFMLDADVDVAIQVDMDEILTAGWRERLEAAWKPGTNRLQYLYVWSWVREGQPDRVFYADKISGRFSHRWRSPIHEVLMPTVPEVTSVCESVIIEHHADPAKPRTNYLELLKLAVDEEPLNDRTIHYYGRELFFNEKYQEAITQFQRHLQLPTARWGAERAASLRFSAKCYEKLNNLPSAYNCYVLATLEDPQSRESYIDLANFLLQRSEWPGVLHYCAQASNIPPKFDSYLAERYAREEGPLDLASVALFNLNQHGPALDLAQRALAMNPNDPRLQENVRMIEQAMSV